MLDQFSLVENPDKSQLLFSDFFRYYFNNYPNYRALQSLPNYKTNLLNYLSSLVPFQEAFWFQHSRNISPIIPFNHFTDLTFHTKQEMDEYLGNLNSSDPDFFPLQGPAN